MRGLGTWRSLLLSGVLSLLATWVCATAIVAGDVENHPNPMLAILEARVRSDPSHADSWRLIAKIHFRDGNTHAALDALNLALEADPESVATHYDFGQILESMGDPKGAATHYAAVCQLAPQSGYAARLESQGFVAAPSIQTVGYEIKTFDGSDDFRRRLEAIEMEAVAPRARLRVFVEAGLLYNNNISLTPITRQLQNVDASSLQGFLNPELELELIDRGVFRSGPFARGYFAVNEQTQSDFDLAAFQGGWFVERDYQFFANEWIGRLDYLYSLDLQGGSRFANRHSMNVSATTIDDEGDILCLYGTLSFSNFENDGTDPAIDSLDGPGFIAGVTRYLQLDGDTLRMIRFGADISSANTDGADYRFVGAGINGGINIELTDRLTLEPEMGLGFRTYDDFTGSVSRDEVVLRLAAKLERQYTDRTAIALVIGHDRFASDHPDFDAERTEGGLVVSWLY